jgi:predicted nucleic acid-binding protein
MWLCDANVLLDVFLEDKLWIEWSTNRLREGQSTSGLAINPIIYAELSPGFSSRAMLDSLLDDLDILRLPLPYDAAFPAGKAFLDYRKRGGAKRSPLPDFYIGAHAMVSGLTLLTRDATRYRTYFPGIALIAPDA